MFNCTTCAPHPQEAPAIPRRKNTSPRLLRRTGTGKAHIARRSTGRVPPGGPPELHVAHCIAGQLRSLYLRSVYTSNNKQSTIDSLEAPGKLFFVVTHEDNLTRYAAAFAYLNPASVIYVPPSDVYSTMEGSDLTLAQRRHLPIVKYPMCFELVRRYERLLDSLFSHVIITRPDVLCVQLGPPGSGAATC